MKTTVAHIGDISWLRDEQLNRLGACDPTFDILAQIGPDPLQQQKMVLPLLSRLPRRTQSEETWIDAVGRLAEEAGQKNWTSISSAGSIGWDYCTWCAAESGICQVIVMPPISVSRFAGSVEKVVRDLNLRPDLTTFIMPVGLGKLTKSERLHLRDQIAFKLADTHFPIAVRDGGYWAASINESNRVDNRYQCDYPTNVKESWRSTLKSLTLKSNSDSGERMVHWTRGVYGPWPGENQADYFHSLRAATGGNPRDGFSSLQFILQSGVLRGQGSMIKGGVPAISFMPFDPGSLPKRIAWRSTLGRWTIEPYGIIADKQTLNDFGARPVIYGGHDKYKSLNDDDKPYFQFRGAEMNGESALWEGEHEWRLLGDLDLTSIVEKIGLIVPTEAEKEVLRSLTNCEIESLIG